MALTQGGTFTQADVDGQRVTYVHTAVNSFADRFAFTVADGGEDGASSVSGVVNIAVTRPAGQENLLLHLPLDDGTGSVAADVSGGGHDGTLVNGAAFQAGTGDGSAFAVRFDGVDDRIDVGILDVTGGGLTVANWFKAASFPGSPDDPRFISQASGTAADDHVFMLGTIGAEGAARLRARVKTGGTTATLIATEGTLATDVWHHAAMTYDGVRLRVYLDGTEVGSMSLSGVVTADPNVPVAVGAQPQGAGNNTFAGLIDDVRIYTRALSAAEIGQLASAGRGD
ncbi:MAG: LamG-like jellyroll fold domain-containing protein [Caldilineaceae bacterium]